MRCDHGSDEERKLVLEVADEALAAAVATIIGSSPMTAAESDHVDKFRRASIVRFSWYVCERERRSLANQHGGARLGRRLEAWR